MLSSLYTGWLKACVYIYIHVDHFEKVCYDE